MGGNFRGKYSLFSRVQIKEQHEKSRVKRISPRGRSLGPRLPELGHLTHLVIPRLEHACGFVLRRLAQVVETLFVSRFATCETTNWQLYACVHRRG